MGFFDKKRCCICGKETGIFFGRTHIAGDEFACDDCKNKTSIEAQGIFSELTKAQILQGMEMLKKELPLKKALCASATDSVAVVGHSDTTAFRIDADQGLWYVPCHGNGFVYRLDQVRNFYIQSTCLSVNDDEIEAFKPTDFASLLGDAFQYVAQYRPDFGLALDSQSRYIAKLEVVIEVKHDVARQVVIPITGGLCFNVPERPDRIASGFLAAQKIFLLLENGGRLPVVEEPEAPAAEPTPVQPPNLMEELARMEALTKLKELLDMGVITQEEFEAKKSRLWH